MALWSDLIDPRYVIDRKPSKTAYARKKYLSAVLVVAHPIALAPMKSGLIQFAAAVLLVAATAIEANAACPTGQCTASVGGSCITSIYGALCAECGLGGYLSAGVCVCYLPTCDPAHACAPAQSFASNISLTLIGSSITCTPFTTQTTGFFAPNNVAHVYGTPNPPLITQCAPGAWGPEPGVVADPLLPGTTVQTCNTYGAADPNAVSGQNSTTFQTCSAHGFWNATTYRCEPCYQGWALADSGLLGYQGEHAILCSACAPFWGPPVGGEITTGPYCNLNWFVSNVTGVGAECAGRGQSNDGVCTCFTNGTLTQVNATFEVLAYTNAVGNAYTVVDQLVSTMTCL